MTCSVLDLYVQVELLHCIRFKIFSLLKTPPFCPNSFTAMSVDSSDYDFEKKYHPLPFLSEWLLPRVVNKLKINFFYLFSFLARVILFIFFFFKRGQDKVSIYSLFRHHSYHKLVLQLYTALVEKKLGRHLQMFVFKLISSIRAYD